MTVSVRVMTEVTSVVMAVVVTPVETLVLEPERIVEVTGTVETKTVETTVEVVRTTVLVKVTVWMDPEAAAEALPLAEAEETRAEEEDEGSELGSVDTETWTVEVSRRVVVTVLSKMVVVYCAAQTEAATVTVA